MIATCGYGRRSPRRTGYSRASVIICDRNAGSWRRGPSFLQLPSIRRFLREVYVLHGARDLRQHQPRGRTRYTRATSGGSAEIRSGVWCAAFLMRYLNHKGLTRLAWRIAYRRSGNGSSASLRLIAPPRRSRRSLMVAIGPPRWDGGIMHPDACWRSSVWG